MDNNKVLNAINQLSTSSDKSNDSSICSLKSKKMHKNLNTIVLLAFLLNSCSFPTTKEAGIQYSTKPAFQLPESMEWRAVGLAKELVNVKEKMVIISGGSKPLPLSEWDTFKARLPWQKNMDRHLLINKTMLVRSPGAASNCTVADCLIERTYKDHSWIELIQNIEGTAI